MSITRCDDGAFRHPFGFEACVNRLYEDYKKHGNLIVAFDFDNTIFDYHNCGGDFSQVIELLKICSDMGFIMILYTANEGNRIDWMVEYCKHYGIRVDFINESPVMQTKKPYYNILLDDRAALYATYLQLKTVINKINSTNNDYNKSSSFRRK